jgi:hypothetical protein
MNAAACRRGTRRWQSGGLTPQQLVHLRSSCWQQGQHWWRSCVRQYSRSCSTAAQRVRGGEVAPYPACVSLLSPGGLFQLCCSSDGCQLPMGWEGGCPASSVIPLCAWGLMGYRYSVCGALLQDPGVHTVMHQPSKQLHVLCIWLPHLHDPAAPPSPLCFPSCSSQEYPTTRSLRSWAQGYTSQGSKPWCLPTRCPPSWALCPSLSCASWAASLGSRS